MRFGWLEIVLIVLVMIAVVIIARVIGFNRAPGGQNEKPDQQTTNSRILTFFNRTGIVLIIAGGITLIATASFFRLILQSYLWASLAIAVGVIILWFSRKNKE